MQFTNEFVIPLEVDEAFAVLTDLERVAPCMPGAALESVDGVTSSGRVKVKLGAMSMIYAGTATVTEKDSDAHRARIQATGRERRGAGTASADVLATLTGRNGTTVVTVTTNLDVSGKPAQFGRGVMADVGERIINQFAENLREELADPTEAETHTTRSALAVHEGDEGQGDRGATHRPRPEEALDLLEVVGRTTAQRLAVAVAVLASLLVILRRCRNQS